MFPRLPVALLCILISLPVLAAENEGDYLYKVSTIRATPGSLESLLTWINDLDNAGYFADTGTERPFIMRHSQGDHWDLLVMTPMESWEAYYTKRNIKRRERAVNKHARLLDRVAPMIAFDEDIFAVGPELATVRNTYENNAFFHIEMFAAAPGKTDALFEQRRMENAYLKATGQIENMIFRRSAGTDVDVFTIGFHESLKTFAAPSPANDTEKEVAARKAGFKNRADLSFYLRSLLARHHDTLAVKVPAGDKNVRPSNGAHAGAAMNLHRINDRLITGGHFIGNGAQFLSNQGVKVVLDLRDKPPDGQKQKLAELGIRWVNIPIVWKSPRPEDFEKFSAAMDEFADEHVMVQCAANYRASSMTYLYRVVARGNEESVAARDLHAVWKPEGQWLDYIEGIKSSAPDEAQP